jgi:hypothetical protein
MGRIATHEDVIRLFPGIQDHASLEILSMKAAVEELEAALLLLQDDDEALIDIKQRRGDRLNVLLAILANSEINLQQDLDR